MKKKTSLSMRQRPPAAKLVVFMLGLQFLLEPFHCEGQDGFFNIKEHSGQGFFREKKTSEGAQPGLSGNRATVRLPTVPGFLEIHISDIFFCPTALKKK